MKKFVGIALVLALALSTAAMAEGTTDPIPAAEVPTVEAQIPAEEAAEAPAETPAKEETDSNAALKDAMDAYRAAKQDKAVDDLEAELKGYVEAGSLTQEQADLILKNVKERIAEANGECPNCGYQFSKDGKGQRGGQQRGGMMGQRSRQQRGQMGGQRGQQRPDAQNGATPQSPMNGQQMSQNGQQPQVPQM